MKWLFYVIVLIYMIYRTVYGANIKETDGVSIEPLQLDTDKKFLLSGTLKTINCTGESNKKKVEWINPSGIAVTRNPKNRVFVQEKFVPHSKSPGRNKVTTQVLVFTSTVVDDTGVWECRAGSLGQNVSLCVIDPSEFVNTLTAVTVDSGRSITLSCQAKGEPEPRLLWYRDGEVIADDFNSSKYQVMTKYNSQGFEGLLTIMSLSAEDSGVYTCHAIQESPTADDCTNEETFNISLQVNHAPLFMDRNYAVVYGVEGESLELICSATGFPIPAYRWFQDKNDVVSEFSQGNIQLINDGTEAVITLEPNFYHWNQRYSCLATNRYGEAEKSFLILRTVTPTKPSKIEPNSDLRQSTIQLEVTWNNGIKFPVTSIDTQHIQAKSINYRRPKDTDWLRCKITNLKPDNVNNEGLNVTVMGLKEDRTYHIRLRAVNSAGKSPWSSPVEASTAEESEVEDEPEITEEVYEKEVTEETEAGEMKKDKNKSGESTFYGIFFAGGIIITAVGFMFLMRLVK